jgi:hypothetical protein
MQGASSGAQRDLLEPPQPMQPEAVAKLAAADQLRRAAAKRAAAMLASRKPSICEDTCFKARPRPGRGLWIGQGKAGARLVPVCAL